VEWSRVSVPSLAFFFGVLAAMGFARIAELATAKRHASRAHARGERVLPEPIFPAMVALHTLPFWLAPIEVVLLDRPFIPWLAAASSAALIGAFAVRVWTLRTLGDAWNVRLVRPAGIVCSGPYAFVRHPNYSVVIVELVALPLVHTAILTSAAMTLLNAVVLSRRIPAEEAMLHSIAGYDAAMAAKPRFIPSIDGWLRRWA
jgi:methyltransferase